MPTYVYNQGFCNSCGTNVKTLRKGTNHVLHLILTICTAGIWSIIWLFSTIKFGGWRCDSCGGKELSSPK
jgi:Na+-transporting NADH:ubiquinone oxidoreductase subunit NqrC